MHASRLLQCAAIPVWATLSASTCSAPIQNVPSNMTSVVPIKRVVVVQGQVAEPDASITLPVADTSYALRLTDAAHGPTQIVAVSNEAYNRITAQVQDVSGYQRAVFLRVSRHVAGCPLGQAMNVASNCRGSAALSFSVDVYPGDNPNLPEGDYSGHLSLVAEKPTGIEGLSIEVDIYLYQFGSARNEVARWQL
jgi:hypothetical protein